MRKSTENEGIRRTINLFTPRSKVKDLPQQQQRFISFFQETPVKPLSHCPTRRMLPLKSPELLNGGHLHSPLHPPQPPGSICSLGPAKRPQSTQNNRQGYPEHPLQSPGCSLGHVPSIPTPAKRFQSTPSSSSKSQSGSFCSLKDFSGIRRAQVTNFTASLSSTRKENVTTQRQESSKVRSNDVKSSLHTVQPYTHSPAVALQDHQQHKGTPSTEKSLPGGSLQKRQREAECDRGDGDDEAKKICLQGSSSGKGQTPECTVGNSVCSSGVSQASSRHSTAKTTDGQLYTEPTSGQSASTQPSPEPYIPRQLPSGAKQVSIHLSLNHKTLRLKDVRSTSKSSKEGNEERNIRINTNTSSGVLHKDNDSSQNVLPNSHHTGHTQRGTSALPDKSPSRTKPVGESRTPKPASKPKPGSLRCGIVERNKTSRLRRPTVNLYDIDDLFTPDPLTYVVHSVNKPANPKVNGGEIKSPTAQKCNSSNTVKSSSSSCSGTPTRKAQSSTASSSPHQVEPRNKEISDSSPAVQPKVFLPTVLLERINVNKCGSVSVKATGLDSSPMPSSDRQLKHEGVKTEQSESCLLPKNVTTSTLETDAPASKQTSTSHDSLATPQEKQKGEGGGKQVTKVDPFVELDLDLSLELDLPLSPSSQSSEEEQLLSLQEMMERIAKPPDTPEKGTYSDPSTPGKPSSQSKPQTFPSTTKLGFYKNDLDQMLKEIKTNKKAKEIETKLLTACKEDLLTLAEYEEDEEDQREAISTEQQVFLQRYSLTSNAIREVPPGEVVFHLEKFGRIFNQNSLQLRQCMVSPQDTAQKTLLRSSPAQLKLHINIGLFQEAYDCCPCPSQVTRFLFKMMSVHTETMMSKKILETLCNIACRAAYQRVKNGNQQFKVWVPSVADVALVLMNMGVPFVTLFPFENLQPPFTEGDLLEDVHIKSESSSSNEEQSIFPHHNCNAILKYLSYCAALCPRAYTDTELLLLLTMVGTVSLDTQLILHPCVDKYTLNYQIIENIRDWDSMLPRICMAFTDLSDNHHNMCLLVHLLPDNTRGRQLRQHLSLSMISKLLDGKSICRPTEKEFQLSDLRPYLRRMQPSTLLQAMRSSSNRAQQEEEEDFATLDQQAYYLCYSLLKLTNEASNFQFFPAHQKEQLLFLSSELETHIKCGIRESEKCLYRSKVKDLVARLYTKWEMLLQRTRPLHGKLYDYRSRYLQIPADPQTSSKKEEEMVFCADEEDASIEEQDPFVAEDGEKREMSGSEEMESTMGSEEELEEERPEAEEEATQQENPAEMKEEDTEAVLGELNQRTAGTDHLAHDDGRANTSRTYRAH